MGLAARKQARGASGYRLRTPGDEFILGVTRPNATNTGPQNVSFNFDTLPSYVKQPTDNQWTNANGVLITYINDPGRVIENVRLSGEIHIAEAATDVVIRNCLVEGMINVRTARTTITNCKIVGIPPSLSYNPYDHLIACKTSTTSDVRIEFCEIYNKYDGNFNTTGIIGGYFTAHRNHIYHVVDGFGLFPYTMNSTGGPVDAVITGNYVHSLALYSQAVQGRPVHTTDVFTHNDIIQIHGGSNIRIEGNDFRGFFATDFAEHDSYTEILGEQNQMLSPGRQVGAVVQYNSATGAVFDTIITRNWIDGGRVSINAAGMSLPNQNIGAVTNNLFGRGQALMYGGPTDGVTFLYAPGTVYTYSGNTYEDNGAPSVAKQNN